MNMAGKRRQKKGGKRMNLKNDHIKEVVIIGGLITIAIVFWFVYSFGFEVRREESAVALTAVKQII